MIINLKPEESLIIGGLDGSLPVEVKCKHVRSGGTNVVSLYIGADRSIPVNRKEVYEKKLKEIAALEARG